MASGPETTRCWGSEDYSNLSLREWQRFHDVGVVTWQRLYDVGIIVTWQRICDLGIIVIIIHLIYNAPVLVLKTNSKHSTASNQSHNA